MVSTAKDLLLARAQDDSAALLFGEQTWSYRQVIIEARRRAAMFWKVADPPRPPHIGVLLENVPDYLFWLAAAGLSGAVVVGINSTYRGEQLQQLITHTDCQMVVTSSGTRHLLEDLDLGPASSHVLNVDSPEYEGAIGADLYSAAPQVSEGVSESDLFLLIFTSGSTGLPKAVRCTQGRFARTGAHVAGVIPLGADDVVYTSLPFFHSSSLFTGWASALTAGVPLATRSKFSASQTVTDLRRHGATVLTYTGKVLNYILAVPEQADDRLTPLRVAMGNEASPRDIAEFARRFDCRVSDAYGSTEGIIIIRRDASMPPDALGRPIGEAPTVKILDPETLAECPPAEYDDRGMVANLEEAVGEIVETVPTAAFEGYYRNENATQSRFRNGWYWSGDLAYRDSEGWYYFAGRSNEWLRVDGENFSAAPVEKIIGRHPDVRAVAVYAVPDDPVGDRVMVAIEPKAGSGFSPSSLDAFLADQPDLGTKWMPAFVRCVDELPKLASMKIDKQKLRRDAWSDDGVWWRPARASGLVPLDSADRERLRVLLN